MMVRQKAAGGVSPTYPYAVGSRWYVGGCFSPPTIYHLPHTKEVLWNLSIA